MNKTCYTPTSLWKTLDAMKNPKIVRIERKYLDQIWSVTVKDGK